jgi:hypothetical protein
MKILDSIRRADGGVLICNNWSFVKLTNAESTLGGCVVKIILLLHMMIGSKLLINFSILHFALLLFSVWSILLH